MNATGGAIFNNRLFVAVSWEAAGKKMAASFCLWGFAPLWEGFSKIHSSVDTQISNYIVGVSRHLNQGNMEKSGSVDSLGSKRNSSRQPSVDSLSRYLNPAQHFLFLSFLKVYKPKVGHILCYITKSYTHAFLTLLQWMLVTVMKRPACHVDSKWTRSLSVTLSSSISIHWNRLKDVNCWKNGQTSLL